MARSDSPSWFEAWKDAGFIRPESARMWLISGFTPDDAAPWYHLDEVEVHIATEWRRAGLTPNDYLIWRSHGFLSASTVLNWKAHFPDPSEARKMRDSGLRVDGRFGELLDRAYSVDVVRLVTPSMDEQEIQELSDWIGQFPPAIQWEEGEARKWMQSGLDSSEIRRWIDRGAHSSLVTEFRQMGWSEREVVDLVDEWGADALRVRALNNAATAAMVLGWSREKANRDEALSWIKSGFTLIESSTWRLLGITDPLNALRWKSYGCSPDEAAMLRRRGLDDFGLLSVFTRRGWKVHDIAKLVRGGLPPALLRRWITQHQMNHARWKRVIQSLLEGQRLEKWIQSEIPPEEWPAWVDGVSPEIEICAQWMTTRISPSELAKMLVRARCGPMDFDTSLRGSQLIEGLQIRIKTAKASSRRLSEEPIGANQISARKTLVVNSTVADVRTEHLVEMQARALYLSPLLRKRPAIGMEFVDDYRGIRLRIVGIGEKITIEVEVAGTTITVVLDSLNFDSQSKIDTKESRAAYLLAVAWFIDCSVVLTKRRRESSVFSSGTSSVAGHKNRQVRYVPTERFADAVRQVQSGRGLDPALHLVSGHLRTLSNGRKPTKEARARAPKFLQSRMGPSDTFVQEHSRGRESEIREYVNKLSRLSMTAHAVALLMR
jgi:hypothetical protein